MLNLRKAAQHVVLYRWGYIIFVFLLIAALTCGVQSGAQLPEKTLNSYTVALTTWNVIWLLAREIICVGVLLLAVMHPFGCALCVVIVLGKAFYIGYSWGWWMAKFGFGGLLPFLLLMVPQGLISLGAYAYGGCITSYCALRVHLIMRDEYFKTLICILILQMIAVLMRCLASAWVGV